MRVILVPLGGEAYDRAAVAEACRVTGPFRAYITGLFTRPGPVEAISVFQGIPPEMVDRVTRAATGSRDDRAALARQALDEARPAAHAALADYIGWHGPICDMHPMYPKEAVGSALPARARELGSRLLVMGGYGRRRMRERVFGGVTRHVIDHPDIPLLIAH